MRKHGTLNGQLSRVISETGHTDQLVITDAGLPIAPGVERVDLAVLPGLPGFLEVLDAVLDELSVEGATVSAEIAEHNPAMLAEIESRLTPLGITIEQVPHVDFKVRAGGARAAVRTGECTSYANVILHAGVTY